MVITTNQNRHLFVAKNAVDLSSAALSAVGDLGVKALDNGVEKEFYFQYMGPKGAITSDRIQVKNLNYVKAVAATDLRIPLKTVEVTLDSNVSATPVAGQDYVLRIDFRQFYGISDNNTYTKDAAVHVTSAIDNAKKFFDKMKEELDLAFSREVGATKTSNPYLSFTVSGSGSSAKLVITEKEQDWTLGTEAVERVLFDVCPTTIFVGGDDVVWGTTTVAAPDTTTSGKYITNGKQIADLEYFCMGERGDQYRMAGWPNVIPTKYLVDETKEYNVLEIHHGFTDTGVNSYRSEKDITIVSDDVEVIDTIIGYINTATGLSIDTLEDSSEEQGNG